MHITEQNIFTQVKIKTPLLRRQFLQTTDCSKVSLVCWNARRDSPCPVLTGKASKSKHDTCSKSSYCSHQFSEKNICIQ